MRDAAERNYWGDTSDVIRSRESGYDMDIFNKNRENVLDYKNAGELDWAHFCCYPDKLTPTRMPSLFPIPSHIVRRRTVKTIDAHKYDRLLWAPEYTFGTGALIGRN
ncbi:MAG: hypothetical protein RL662_2038 [Bacteroidota bacterium]|jgi:hypothetical protein